MSGRIEAPEKEGVEQFVTEYERVKDQLAEQSPAWLMERRRAGIAAFAQHGFPTIKDEAWRQTNIAPIKRTAYQMQAPAVSDDALARLREQLILSPEESYRIVIVNGAYNDDLSNIHANAQSDHHSLLMTFDEALHSDAMPEALGSVASVEDNAFTALNTALFSHGVLLRVSDGAALDRPVYIVYATVAENGAAFAQHPRTLILAGQSSEFKVLEHFIGIGDGAYLTNHVTEVLGGENASLQHYKLQQESPAAFHVSAVRLKLADDNVTQNFSIALGSTLARNEIVAELTGSGVDCTLNGLYLAQGTQHIDHHTRIEHIAPHCHSTEVYKGILDEQATAVFSGLIHVHPNAQKTDAVQSSKCVLLSDSAHVDSQPQLKIFADDVKCTHGAAIGQLNEEAVFYLRSRGISENDARGLLTYAFANDIVERIKIEPLRLRLAEIVSRRFNATEYSELG